MTPDLLLSLSPPVTFAPDFALLAAADFRTGAGAAIKTIMILAFLIGGAMVIGGGYMVSKGDAERGKVSVVGGIIVAAGFPIMKALMEAFGWGADATPDF